MSIYNQKTNFLVIDIETCLISNNFIFDLSYVVYNRLQGITQQKSYIVKENEFKPTFYDKQDKYAKYLQDGVYSKKYFKHIMHEMQQEISKNGIRYVAAYNSGFDLERIDRLCAIKRIENPLNSLVEIDLYHTACQTLGQQKGFKRFTDRFNLKSDKGNRRSSAQAMYQYITLDPSFTEEHTGYSDLKIEVEILDLILRQRKKMDVKRNQHSWKLVQG